MEAKELLRSLFQTENPANATRGRNGETLATQPPTRERREGDYLPVIAVLVGLALVGVAVLNHSRSSQEPLQLAGHRSRQEEQEEISEDGW